MKIQLAFDYTTVQNMLKVLKSVRDVIDIVEIGTPMIIKYGVEAVKVVKNTYPELTVLSDVKIMDGGEYEAQTCVDAGADIITVMGVANESTIIKVVETAKKSGRKTLIDMMNVPDPVKTVKFLNDIGADYICIHNAYDALDMDKALSMLGETANLIPKVKLVIAGGINMDTAAKVRAFSPEIAIIGTVVRNSDDPRGTIIELRKALEA